jgi:hypothetical protein
MFAIETVDEIESWVAVRQTASRLKAAAASEPSGACIFELQQTILHNEQSA